MNYNKFVPEDSFMGQYMKYMSVLETPLAYDFWTAAWLVGVACGRGVYIDRPSTPIYLNHYVILAAESGITRKTTAVMKANEIAQHLDIPIITDKQSPETLLKAILSAKDRTIAITIGELITILGREAYMKPMPGFLTDTYDGSRQEYVSLLSASTPSWLLMAVNPTVIEGGFTSRVMFIFEEHRKKVIAWPVESPVSKTDLVWRLKHLGRQAKLIGGLKMGTGGMSKYKGWYGRRTVHRDPYRASFESREHDHVLKLAALLCINDGSMEVQARHFTHALAAIDAVKHGGHKLFGVHETTEMPRIVRGIDRLRSKLLEAGIDGIKHRDLYMKVRDVVDNDEFKLLLAIMHEMDMIQVFKATTGATQYYRATKAVMAQGSAAEVLARLALRQEHHDQRSLQT